MSPTIEQNSEAADESGRYVLRLFVSDAIPRSNNAIANIRAICEKELAGRYELEVIDICQKPEVARTQQIIALPTLIKSLPPPIRRLVGDLSQEEKVLVGLDLIPKKVKP